MVIERCPFCKNNLLDVRDKKTGMTEFSFVHCPKCGASGPHGISREQTINWWNTAAGIRVKGDV